MSADGDAELDIALGDGADARGDGDAAETPRRARDAGDGFQRHGDFFDGDGRVWCELRRAGFGGDGGQHGNLGRARGGDGGLALRYVDGALTDLNEIHTRFRRRRRRGRARELVELERGGGFFRFHRARFSGQKSRRLRPRRRRVLRVRRRVVAQIHLVHDLLGAELFQLRRERDVVIHVFVHVFQPLLDFFALFAN